MAYGFKSRLAHQKERDVISMRNSISLFVLYKKLRKFSFHATKYQKPDFLYV